MHPSREGVLVENDNHLSRPGDFGASADMAHLFVLQASDAPIAVILLK